MSRSIEERIVDMQFNNKQFEDGISNSLTSLKNLTKGLDETGKGPGLEGLESGIKTISDKFSTLGIIGVTALQNITNAAIQTGAAMLKSITTEPIITGFSKYEQKVGSVQTIMNATGKTIEEVSKSLEKLNWFTDETSYSFTDMVSNIGKFTSAGVDLDTSITAMQGIANAAALSGQGTNEASRAMYNFAQALGVGSVKLMDWKSIENANMATVEFKQTVIDTALSLGTLKKKTDDTYKTMKGTTVSVKNFNTALSEGWFSSEVLIKSLEKYGEYADAVFEVATREGISCADAMNLVSGETMNLGMRAFKAAQEAKTFTDALNAVKDAVSTGWMTTFEILFGNYVEAKELWTELANTMWDVFASGAEVRNELLQVWKDLGGREDLIQSFRNAFEAIVNVVTPIKDAFREIFPSKTAEDLFALTEGLRKFTEGLIIGEEKMSLIKTTALAAFGLLSSLLEPVVASFDVLKEVIKIVGTAFQNVFPASLNDKVSGLTNLLTGLANGIRGFADDIRGFAEGLKMGDENSDKLRRTFEGLFSVVDIGKQFFSFLIEKLGDLLTFLSPGAGSIISGILTFTSTIGDWLVQLDEAIKTSDIFNKAFDTVKDGITKVVTAVKEDVKGMLATPFFQDLQENLTLAKEKIGEAFDKIVEVFSKWGGIDLSGAKAFVSGAVEGFRPFTALGNLLSGAFEVIKKILEKIWPVITHLASIVGSAFTALGDSISGAFREGGFQGVLDLINTGIFTGILLGLKGVIDGFKDIVKDSKGFVEGITGILDGVRDSLTAYQNQLKANTLLTIAGAIGILAAALLVLALIDPARLTGSLAAITVLFIELAGSMIVLQKSLGTIDMVKISGQLVLFSSAILILSIAMKNLADLDWNGIAKGTVGVAALAAVLVASAKIMADGSSNMSKAGIGMIAMSAAILILSQAVKSMGELDLESLAKGLSAVGILLLELAGFTQIVKPDKLISTGIAMIAMGAAIKIFASAIGDLGALDVESLIKGVSAIGVILAEIAVFSQLLKPDKLISTGIAMTIMGAAMLIFGNAIAQMGSLSWEEIGKGLSAMAGSLGIIVAAMNLMPKDLAGKAAGMLILSTSLLILGQALGNMGGMSWEEIARSLTTLAGALTIITVAMQFMSNGLAGAAAMMVMSAALLALTPTLLILGGMDLAEIGTALLALVGVFVIVGGSAAILAPLTPVILGLAAGIALLGVGVAAIGVGLLAFSAGLTALAISGAAGAAAMVTIVASLSSLIPMLIGNLAKGVIEFSKVIVSGMPSIMEAIRALFEGIITLLEDLTPSIVEGALKFIVALLVALATYIPQMVDAGMKLLNGILDGVALNIADMTIIALKIIAEFLRGIAEGIPGIVTSAADIIVAFLNAIANEQPRVVDSGFKLIISFINGIADAIRENTPELIVAITNVATAIVDGLVNGLISGAKNVADAAINLGKSALTGIKDFLQIHSPSQLFENEVGSNIALGTAKGIDKNSTKAEKAAKAMADKSYKAATLWIKNYQNDTDYLITEELKMWEILATRYKGISQEKVTIDTNIAKLRKKIREDEFKEEKAKIQDYKNDMEYMAIIEMGMWEDIADKYEAMSKERLEIDKNIKKLRETVAKESFENEKALLEERKSMGELSLLEEVQSLDRIRQLYEEGTDTRKKADKEYYSAKTKLLEEQEKLVEKMEKTEEDYQNKVDERAQAIANTFSLFEELKAKEEVSTTTLKDNLKAQVDEMKDWAKNLQTLAGKGIDEGLLAELSKMGPSANAEIKALSTMTESELTSYGNLWKEKMAIGKEQAIIQLVDLRDETNKKVAEIKKELDALTLAAPSAEKADVSGFIEAGRASMNAVITGYQDITGDVVNEAKSISNQANNEISSWQPKYTETGKNLIQAVINGFNAKRQDTINTAKTITTQSIGEMEGYHNNFYQTGSNSIAGFIDGMRSKLYEAADMAAQIALAAYRAAMEALGIASPSKAFIEIGEFVVMGLARGLEKYSYLAENESADMGRNVIQNFKDTLSKIKDIFSADLDMSPVITPVIDMDEVEQALERTFSTDRSLKLSEVVDKASRISRTISQDRQETDQQSINGETVKSISFTQNNYSPKALSRVEIYRNTKNQFSAMKEVLD